MAQDAAPGEAGAPASIVLLWIPVGAGGHVVHHTSRWWELAQAWRERREPRQLFHAALEVAVDGARFVIEMAPAWGGPAGRGHGVVQTGPVGLRRLGRWRFFRYEVRCWRDGLIPDRGWAVGGPVVVSSDAQAARAVLTRIVEVPPHVWGRPVEPGRDMWNSNSLVSWLLVLAGVATDRLGPPGEGRAPGWEAGLAVADGL